MTEQEASCRLRSTGAGAKHAGRLRRLGLKKKAPSSPSFIHSFIPQEQLCVSISIFKHLNITYPAAKIKAPYILQELQGSSVSPAGYITAAAHTCPAWHLFTNTEGDSNTTHHGLLDLVVDGHHTCTRGAETHKGNTVIEDAPWRRRGGRISNKADGGLWRRTRHLPAVDPHRRALLPEHRGQKRNREIPQLTNAKIHRHRVTLGIHATPSIKTPTGESSGGRKWIKKG